MIAESFGSRTLANMEAALEWARNAFSTGAEEHGSSYIANKILNCENASIEHWAA
jgi:hypothetical protein